MDVTVEEGRLREARAGVAWRRWGPYLSESRVAYEPAESRSGMPGGNSNWRDPVSFPVNMLILRALLPFYLFYGDSFRMECPTGSGNEMTLYQAVAEISRRPAGTFLREPDGRRPVYGGMERFQNDPHWRELILFHEYFHGDNGAGLGASHQTGWTGVVTRLIQQLGNQTSDCTLHGSDLPMTVPYRRLADQPLADLATAREAGGAAVSPTPSTPWPRDAVVYELGTWPWLTDLEGRYGRAMTLADVPGEVWDDVARAGVDAVWLMGIWERSPAGASIARTHPAMVHAQRDALPNGTDADVVGSAYCVRRYRVDPRFGGEAGLAAARAALASRGARLLLDWVPNHVAPDHPWVAEHPEYFVHGTPDAVAADPDGYLTVGDHVLARGRDPYFPAWPEVLQLDTTAQGVREAAAAELALVAEHCDGVRCDMAMLVLDDVVDRTWRDLASRPAPGAPGYWPTVMAAVHARRPDFAFFAEAYWGLEGELLKQGFDACYDKTLYDRVVDGDSGGIRAHLSGADAGWQHHTVRFLENHDEPRAASVLTSARQRTAALLLLTVPGVVLLHEGQFEGRRVHVPVTLGRRPNEPRDVELAAWYRRLVDRTAGIGLRRGDWAWCEPTGWPDNRSCEQLGSWCWSGPAGRHLVVVNLGGGVAQSRIRWPWPEDGGTGRSGRPVGLRDLLTDTVYERDADELRSEGLYVAVDGYGGHLFVVD